MAGITRNPNIDIKKRAVVVMCADNGVVEEGCNSNRTGSYGNCS